MAKRKKKESDIKHIEALSEFTLFTGDRQIFLNKGNDGWHMYDSIGHHNLEAPTLEKLNQKAKEILDDLAKSLQEQGYGKK